MKRPVPVERSSASPGESKPGGSRGAGLLKRLLKVVALLVLIAAAVAPLSLLFQQQKGGRKGTLDFANFYMAGEIVRQGFSRHLYDLRLQREVESKVSAGGPFLPYYHPPFEAPLFAAFTIFSYPHALRVWAAMNLAVLVLVFYLLGFTGYRLGTESYLTWLAVVIFLTIGALLLGQDTILLAPVFLLGFLALKRQREYAAGIALGFGLFRFEILLPFLFIFLLRRRWRVLGGFVTTGAAAIAVSVGVVGWQGLLDYAETLSKVGASAGKWTTMVDLASMPSLRGAVGTFLGGVIPSYFVFPVVLLGTLALLGWAAWEFQNIEKPGGTAFDLEFSMAAVAALLSSYHLFVHELTPLIVVGFLMLGYDGTRRREGILGNRRGTALLLIFAAVYGVGGAVFHFRDFSVLFIVLLGLMVWLSEELASQRNAPSAG